MKPRILITCIAVAFTAVSSSTAAVIEYTNSVPMMRTNWSTNVELPRFDPALGTLESVGLTVDGLVQGSASFQNLNASVATITTVISARIQLHPQPDTLLIATTPQIVKTDTVAPYTGSISFDGPDARHYTDLVAAAVMTRDVPPLNLANFIGTGMLSIPIESKALSSVTGPGNLLVQFSTFAAANVTVTYGYSPIPEPMSLAFFGIAAGALLRKRR